MGFEVYPHMVEQLICKMKEAQEKTPKRIAARKDFDEMINTYYSKKYSSEFATWSQISWADFLELLLKPFTGISRINFEDR